MPTAQTTKVRAKLTARTFIWLQGLSGLIGFAVLLEIVPRLGIVSPDYLPPFSAIMVALFKEMMTATFWTALSDTLEAWAIGSRHIGRRRRGDRHRHRQFAACCAT